MDVPRDSTLTAPCLIYIYRGELKAGSLQIPMVPSPGGSQTSYIYQLDLRDPHKQRTRCRFYETIFCIILLLYKLNKHFLYKHIHGP